MRKKKLRDYAEEAGELLTEPRMTREAGPEAPPFKHGTPRPFKHRTGLTCKHGRFWRSCPQCKPKDL